MCKINNVIQDLVEYEARKLARSNAGIEFDDLVQEGLIPMLSDSVKPDQAKRYYKKIAFTAMLDYIEKEKNHGIVINKHGGDRKSDKFKNQQDLLDNMHVVSLDSLSTELPDTPLHFGIKTSVPDYDDYDYPASSNDRLTENYLKGRDV